MDAKDRIESVRGAIAEAERASIGCLSWREYLDELEVPPEQTAALDAWWDRMVDNIERAILATPADPTPEPLRTWTFGLWRGGRDQVQYEADELPERGLFVELILQDGTQTEGYLWNTEELDGDVEGEGFDYWVGEDDAELVVRAWRPRAGEPRFVG